MANKPKRLSRKISTLILLAALLSLGMILPACVLFILPNLQEESIESAKAKVQLISFQVQDKIDLIESYAASISDSYEMQTALQAFFQNPQDEHRKEAVVDVLDNKMSEMYGTLVIAVQPADDVIITTTRAPSTEEETLFYSERYQSFRRLDYAHKFFSVYKVPYSIDHAWGNEPLDRYAATFCRNFHVGNRRCTITVFAQIDDIIQATNTLSHGWVDSYIWLDNDHVPFIQAGEYDIYPLVQEQLEDRLLYNYDVIREPSGHLFLHTNERSKWTFCAYMSDHTLLQVYGGTFTACILLTILLVVLMIALILPQVNRYTRPLFQLNETMQRVGQGDLTIRSDIRTDDEVGTLSDGFNHMIQSLNSYINQLLEKEKTEQHMKYSLLISQIDPHFIYNTMNSINYLARKQRNQDIIAINSALIRILQDRLRINGIETFDTVAQEIDMIRQYMIIQHFRYGNQVQAVYEIQPGLENEPIPKNILQPLVENAFIHGFTDEEGESLSGVITIRIQAEDALLNIQVSDTGCGISPEKLEKLNNPCAAVPQERGRHIGIQNIRERLKYLYNQSVYFSISSRNNAGTCVTILLPRNPAP